MTTCIIQAGTSDFSGSFIHAHAEYLSGKKVILKGAYPAYAYKGKTIRYFYGKQLILKKIKKLLPQFLYHRWVTQWEETYEGIHDALTGFFKYHNVDVILAEFGHNGAYICRHARDLNIPLIVHFHGHDAHHDEFIEPLKLPYREMFDYAYRIVSVSHFMTEKLIRLGADESKIVYNPYGPRDIFYENRSEYTNSILAVGRFTDIKAPYITLMAFKKLLDTCPNTKLVMVGVGPLLECCKSMARAWHIESKIEFTGGIPHGDVLSYFREPCCFVQHSVIPSYGDAEGTPNTILEAGAAGLPVVCTRHAGIQDVVIHGETGFLVKERDVEGMTKYMCSLVQDEDLCRSMGERARNHIRSNYNIKRHISCLQDLIKAARER